ncbi:MAG: ribonuclease HII [Treponemataceae bacterium]
MSKLLCGLDEAGRGPIAGPVCAGCVILGHDFDASILNDSKKLSEKKRNVIEAVIKEKAVAWSVALVSHEVIDKINILQASLTAMKNAFESLHTPDGKVYNVDCKNICRIIVDGLYVPQIFVSKNIELFPLVKADSKIPEVMAASILAKNERDRVMMHYHALFPQYSYDKHKGYPTKLHKELCKKYGPSPIQRLSFKY